MFKSRFNSKIFKKTVSLVCAATLVLCCSACSGNEKPEAGTDVVLYTEGMQYTETEKGTPETYYSCYYSFLGGETVMPIGGFYSPYAAGGSLNGNDLADFLTDEVFQAIKDCGINNMFYSIDRWPYEAEGVSAKVNKALDLCEKYGIGNYVQTFYIDSQIGTRQQDISLSDMPLNTAEGKQHLQAIWNNISQNGTRECVLGLLACDEPFPKQCDNLGVVSDAFYSLENIGESNIYMNMVGNWEGNNTFWGQSDPISFTDYIKLVMDNIDLPYLSFTQYPFSSADTPEERITAYFNELSIYRKIAYDNQMPHFRMLQAGGQWNDRQDWIDTVDPYPSEGEMLFDVNTSLAYGAKGIQYFPLVQPEHFAYETGEQFDFENRNGLIGGAGNLTRWYYYAKRANAQVAAVDEYLMCSAHEGVIVHGEDAEKYIVTNGEPGDELIRDKKFRELTAVSGDDCIIGCFDYKGGTALYVVNYDRHEKGTVTLDFDKNDYRYKVIQRAQSCDVVGGRITLTLDYGESALISLY